MRKHKSFWDRNAGRYDRFMRKDQAAYEEMYKLIRSVVKAKNPDAYFRRYESQIILYGGARRMLEQAQASS